MTPTHYLQRTYRIVAQIELLMLISELHDVSNIKLKVECLTSRLFK